MRRAIVEKSDFDETPPDGKVLDGQTKLVLNSKTIKAQVLANRPTSPVLPKDLDSFASRQEWVDAMEKYLGKLAEYEKAFAEYEQSIAEVDRIRPIIHKECDRAIRDENGEKMIGADGKEILCACPFVGCSNHLYSDVDPVTGNIKINYPELSGPEEMDPRACCALDIAKTHRVLPGKNAVVRGLPPGEVGDLLGVPRERINQIEERSLRKLRSNLMGDAVVSEYLLADHYEGGNEGEDISV